MAVPSQFIAWPGAEGAIVIPVDLSGLSADLTTDVQVSVEIDPTLVLGKLGDLSNFRRDSTWVCALSGNGDPASYTPLGVDAHSDRGFYWRKWVWSSVTPAVLDLKLPPLSAAVTAIVIVVGGESRSNVEALPSAIWGGDVELSLAMDETSGNIIDRSPNGNDLTNTGADYGGTGQIGDGLDFVAANSDRLSHATFLDTFPAAVTLEAWVKIDDKSTGRYIMHKDQVATFSDRIALIYDQPNDAFSIWGEAANAGNVAVVGTTSPTVGVWYHVAGTYAAGGVLTLYVNGVSEGTPAAIGTIANGTQRDFSVGAVVHSSTGALLEFWDGVIDEAAVHSTAKTADELLAYHALTQAPLVCNHVVRWQRGIGMECLEGALGSETTAATATSKTAIDWAGDTAGLSGPVEDELAVFDVSASIPAGALEDEILVLGPDGLTILGEGGYASNYYRWRDFANGILEVVMPALNSWSHACVWLARVVSGATAYEASAANVWAAYAGAWDCEDADTQLSDVLGNNDATIGGGSPAFGATGKLGDGVDFELDDTDWFTIATPSAGIKVGTGDFSAWAWVKIETDGIRQTIFGARENGAPTEGWFLGVGNDDKVHAFIDGGGPGVEALSTGTLTVGVWHHVGGVWDRDGNATAYLDGVAGTPLGITGETGDLDHSDNFAIGYRGPTASSWSYLDGVLDEVGLVKVAQSDDQMKALHATQEGSAISTGETITAATSRTWLADAWPYAEPLAVAGQADLVCDLKVPFSFTCADAEIEADAADLRICNADFYPVPHVTQDVSSAAGTTTVTGYVLMLYVPTGGTTLYAMHGAGAITDAGDANAVFSGLTGYWAMDDASGAITDLSPNSNDGTNNGATYGVSGRVLNALDFESANSDYVSVGDLGVDLKFLSFWMKPATEINTGSNIGSPVSFIDGGGDEDTWLQTGSSTGDVTDETLTIVDQVGTNSRTAITNVVFAQDVWAHIVIAWNSSASRYDIYVNGTLQAVTSGVVTHVPLSALSAFVIGSGTDRGAGRQSFFDGSIDEVSAAVDVRVAAHVSAIWKAGAGTLFTQAAQATKPENFATRVDYAKRSELTIPNATGADLYEQTVVVAVDAPDMEGDNDLIATDLRTGEVLPSIVRPSPVADEAILYFFMSCLPAYVGDTVALYTGEAADTDRSNADDTWADRVRAAYLMDMASGVATDQTRFGNDGTANGSPTYRATGLQGYAVDLEAGSSQYFALGNDDSLGPMLGGVVAVVKTEDVASATAQWVVDRKNTQAAALGLMKETGADKWHGQTKLDASNTTARDVLSDAISDTSWVVLELTFDGSDLVLYRDGVAQADVDATDGIIDQAALVSVMIGASATPDAYFDGMVNHVRLPAWPSVAEEAAWINAAFRGTGFSLGFWESTFKGIAQHRDRYPRRTHRRLRMGA